MKLPKEITTVTRLSKLVAMILFVALPIVGFILGMRHQQIIDSPTVIITYPTPTIDETANPDSIGANWKSYTNKKIGFEIKYPSPDRLPYVTVGDFGGQPKNVDGTEENTVIQFPGLGPKYDVAFSLELFPYNGTLEDLPESPAQKRLYYSGIDYTGPDKAPVLKKTKINDNETIWFKKTETEDERMIGEVRYEIYLVAKDHAFIFHINSELSENDADQILTTFKFTN